MPNCNRCNTELRDGQQFCSGCGLPYAEALAAAGRCPACGGTTEPNQKFCPACGAALIAAGEDLCAVSGSNKPALPDLSSPTPLLSPEEVLRPKVSPAVRVIPILMVILIAVSSTILAISSTQRNRSRSSSSSTHFSIPPSSKPDLGGFKLDFGDPTYGNTTGNISNTGFAAADLSRLYFITPSGLFSSNKDGSDRKLLLVAPDSSSDYATLSDLALIDGKIHYISLQDGYPAMYIMEKDGSNNKLFASFEEYDYAYFLGVRDNKFYYDLVADWEDDSLHEVYEYDANTDSSRYLADNGWFMDDNGLFFTDYGKEGLYLYSFSTKLTTLISGESDLYPMFVADGYVYCVDDYLNQVCKVPLTGGKKQLVLDAKEGILAQGESLYMLNYQDEYLYLSTKGGGIYRARLDGSELELLVTMSTPSQICTINGEYIVIGEYGGAIGLIDPLSSRESVLLDEYY